MANTGIKNVLTLRKYVNGVATNEFKSNVVGDPDYIAPYEDLASCPISGTTPVPEPPPVYTVGFRTETGSPISSFACDTADQTLYASTSTFGNISIGTKIYSGTSGILFAGGNLWFGIASSLGDATKTILIDNSGIVTNQGECETASPPPQAETGFCYFIWVLDGQTTYSGLRYRPPGGVVTDTPFSILGEPYSHEGNDGTVYLLCSTLTPSALIGVNAVPIGNETDPEIYNLTYGELTECSVNNNCNWVAPPSP